jgi:hypothetical protein
MIDLQLKLNLIYYRFLEAEWSGNWEDSVACRRLPVYLEATVIRVTVDGVIKVAMVVDGAIKGIGEWVEGVMEEATKEAKLKAASTTKNILITTKARRGDKNLCINVLYCWKIWNTLQNVGFVVN